MLMLRNAGITNKRWAISITIIASKMSKFVLMPIPVIPALEYEVFDDYSTSEDGWHRLDQN